jgi:hypothetical protein
LDYPAQLFIETCHNELRVLKSKPGDKLSLTSDGFARLATAFFAGIERKYGATQRQMPPVPAVRRRQFHHVRFRVPR